MGGGVLMDIGVHYVRGLRLLMGEPDQVFASRAMQVDTKISGEDSVQLIFNSSRGWQGHFLLNWAGPRGDSPDIIISGEKGVIHLWPSMRFYDLYPALPTPLTRCLSYVRPAWLADKLSRPAFQKVRRPVPDADPTGYLQEVQEFLAAIAEGRDPVSKPEDARRDVEIVLKGYRSLENDAWESCAPELHRASHRAGY
jgi:predicted dehydrogenase